MGKLLLTKFVFTIKKLIF